jgi:IS6 family transposase
MAAERGLKIERSTICRWVHEYGAMLAKFIKPLLKSTEGSWRLDESVPQEDTREGADYNPAKA